MDYIVVVGDLYDGIVRLACHSTGPDESRTLALVTGQRASRSLVS